MFWGVPPPNFKKTQESKNGFPQDSKNKEKTNKTHAQGEDQRQSHRVGRNRGAADRAKSVLGGTPPHPCNKKRNTKSDPPHPPKILET